MDTTFTFNPEEEISSFTRVEAQYVWDDDIILTGRFVQTNRPIKPNTKQIIGYLEFDGLDSTFLGDSWFHPYTFRMNDNDATFTVANGKIAHYFDADSLYFEDWKTDVPIDLQKESSYELGFLKFFDIYNERFPLYIVTKNFTGTTKGYFNLDMLISIYGAEPKGFGLHHIHGEQKNIVPLVFSK